MEVGPLARMIIGVAKGDARELQNICNNILKNGNLPTSVLFSTVGRTAARAIETELMADVMMEWLMS